MTDRRATHKSNRRPGVAAGLAILGLVLIVVAVIYLTKSAEQLPSFFPGHQAGSAHKHSKHGLAALILAVLSFLGAWFSLGSRSAGSGR